MKMSSWVLVFKFVAVVTGPWSLMSTVRHVRLGPWCKRWEERRIQTKDWLMSGASSAAVVVGSSAAAAYEESKYHMDQVWDWVMLMCCCCWGQRTSLESITCEPGPGQVWAAITQIMGAITANYTENGTPTPTPTTTISQPYYNNCIL